MKRLGRLSGVRTPMSFDRVIGCVAITQPVFFAPDDWIPVPSDWSRNIVSGRGYDLTEGEGLRLWAACLEQAAHTHYLTEWTTEAIELRREVKGKDGAPHHAKVIHRHQRRPARQATGHHAAPRPGELPPRCPRRVRRRLRSHERTLAPSARVSPHPALEGRRKARALERIAPAP